MYTEKKMSMLLSHKEKVEQPCPESFVPSETNCFYSEGPAPLTLNPPQPGQVFMKHVKVYTKTYKKCQMTYRYQDYKDGFYNFNNFSFFSIRVLEHFYAGYRSGSSLEETEGYSIFCTW